MYNPVKPYNAKIIDLVRKTWKTPYLSIQEGVYPIIKKKFSGLEVDHVDGIGTKGIYHWEKGTFKNAVLDALAMNLNDMALVRAIPYKLQDQITLPQEDERLLVILKTLSRECVKRKIAITGGETSFHNNVKALDISLSISGFVKKKTINQFKVGYSLIGLESNGLHSNGFTLVRKLFKKQFRKEFTDPTHIYLDTILELDKKYDIHGMMHITGGAYSKLKGIIKNTDVKISRKHKLKPQSIFKEIYEKLKSDEKMYTTFNCGVGFILSVPREQAEVCLKDIKGFKADIIGEVVAGNGTIEIESMFSNKNLKL